MKKLLLLFILTLSVMMEVNAQEKKIELSSEKIGSISCKYNKLINLESKDTTFYLILLFQNVHYSSIIDTKAVMFTDQVNLDEFIKDLKTALPEMGTKVSINWSRDLYSLSLHDFSAGLYLSEKSTEGSGYTVLNKKGVEKLIAWLETIHMGNGQLNTKS